MVKEDEIIDLEEEVIGIKFMIVFFISCMLLLIVIMVFFLVFIVKYFNVSIFDDLIFIIVCFFLSGVFSVF